MVEGMVGKSVIKVGFFSIIENKDRRLENEVKTYSLGKGFIYFDYRNVKENCLNNSKLKSNKEGTTLFRDSC